MKKDKNDRKPLPSNEEDDDVKNLASEPKVSYKKMSLQKFNSFEEMNEANARAMAQLSGEEHLQNATELIIGIYADKLQKPMDKKIKFRK